MRRLDVLFGCALLAVVAAGCVTDPYYYDHRHGRGYNRPPYNERIYDDRPDDYRPPYSHHDRDEYKPPTLVCASKDGGTNRCHTEFPIQRADVDKRYSDSPCDYGRSWGYDHHEVWVDKGCRARFTLTPAGHLR